MPEFSASHTPSPVTAVRRRGQKKQNDSKCSRISSDVHRDALLLFRLISESQDRSMELSQLISAFYSESTESPVWKRHWKSGLLTFRQFIELFCPVCFFCEWALPSPLVVVVCHSQRHVTQHAHVVVDRIVRGILPAKSRAELQMYLEPGAPELETFTLPPGYAVQEVRLPEQCNSWIREHVYGAGVTAVGFDTESAPYNHRGVDVVQIATELGCMVLQLSNLEPAGPPTELVRLLGDVTVQKIGVGLASDIARLPCGLHGTVELQRQPSFGISRLAAVRLGVYLTKDCKMTISNWARNFPLSARQLEYAASDALVPLLIHLAEQREQ